MTNFPIASNMPRQRRFVGRLGVAIFLLVAVGVGIWLQRASLLRGVAELWIISDQVTPADAVAVLGGDLDTRPFVAADLYKRGLVPRVLVSQVKEGRASTLGLIPGHSELNRMVLLKLGVPDAAIAMFGEANGSTKDEAVALRDWADGHDISRIIVPTECFSARRVRWIFDREFAGTSVRLEIPTFGADYTCTEWWKSEAGMIAFQNEVMKYLYYRLKY